MAKVALVTGGGRGIGAAVSLRLAQDGWAVAVNYKSNAAAADAVVAAIATAGGRAVALQGDTAREDEVLRLFEAVDARLGPLDGLVNNAGVVGGGGPLSSMTVERLRTVLDTNVLGYFLCAREAVRRMTGRGGAIVNVSSRLSVLGGAGELTHYAASKAAIDAMTVGLAQEVAKERIRVNCVRPGVIATEIHQARPANVLQNIERGIPLGRIGRPEEVAESVAFLLSERASYSTGAILDVGGGR